MSGNAGRTRATAVITVRKYEPSASDEPAQGPVLTRIHVEESFSGDINGDGIVEFLQAALADGSASFVGIERVTGDLGGRRGTFLLQDAGTVQDNIVSGDSFVIARVRAPGSWPAFAARAGSAPNWEKAPRCTWTTGSNEAPARHRHQRAPAAGEFRLREEFAQSEGQDRCWPLRSADLVSLARGQSRFGGPGSGVVVFVP